jgi:ornithine carbamoyltransferase
MAAQVRELNPAATLKGRDFVSLLDFYAGELAYLLNLAQELKDLQRRREPHHLLRGKTLGMYFAKASTRTRLSFEVGIYQLGGYGLFLSANDLQLRRGETIADSAKVFSRYLDGLMIRTFAHRDVEELAEYADIPIINGLTDLLHPCQAMADALTIIEKLGGLRGVKLTYLGDGNNMANSLLELGAMTGMHVTIGCPAGYEPDAGVLARCREAAVATGARLEVVRDPMLAAEGADVIYTDVWASMGQEHEHALRAQVMLPYQVNERIMARARKGAIFMHCLPAHRGEEVAAAVIDGPQSVVFDEAENRLHVQKAILAAIMA